MNLLMAATPIAMQQCGLPFSDAALVLEWHVIGMFAPGFFTGHLIKRFGALPIMGVGAVLYALGCIAVALSGTWICTSSWLALFLLGVGWNFRVHRQHHPVAFKPTRPEEKDRAQGALNFFVFATLAVSSLASGRVGHHQRVGLAQLRLDRTGGGHLCRPGVAGAASTSAAPGVVSADATGRRF
jgi:predicted MFS family arabinose efflux permease